MRLVFLGTGGGRHMMFAQVRATGGMFFDLDDVKFIVDPGPGSLVHARALNLNIDKLNGIFVSHLHPDNCSDVNAILDGLKEPFVVAEEHCILPMDKINNKVKIKVGKKDKEKVKKFIYYPIITHYHQNLTKHLHPVKHGDKLSIRNFNIEVYKSMHYDPTVGFKIIHPNIKIGYPADGPYYKDQEKYYDDCDLLILNVLIPKGIVDKEKKHMSVDDAIKLLKGMKSKPKIVIMQHFSFWMMRSNLWKQAKILHDATDVNVLNAEDFMEVDLNTFETKILKKKG